MQITRIAYEESGGASVFVDGEAFAVLNAADIQPLGLVTDMDCDGRLLSKIRAAARRFNARKKAFDCAARTDLSKKALTRKLVEKGIEKESAEEAAGYLEQRGYLDDRTLAARIVQAYGPEKCFGRRRVEQELFRRGIPKELIEDALAQLPPDGELIAGLYERRFERYDITDLKTRKRVYNALLRYGFDYEDIRREMASHGSDVTDE